MYSLSHRNRYFSALSLQNSLQNANGNCNYFNKRRTSSLRSERNAVFFLCLWLLIAVLCWLTFRRAMCGWLKTRLRLSQSCFPMLFPLERGWPGHHQTMPQESVNQADRPSLWMWSALSSQHFQQSILQMKVQENCSSP